MSAYVNFNYCVICRSAKNLKEYKGDYEVTMLLNTLYMAVMQPIENRKGIHAKSKEIERCIRRYAFVNDFGNNFDSDTVVRYFRNGLAHFNIKVLPDDLKKEKISQVIIWAENRAEKPLCKKPCVTPQCVPVQHEADANGAICRFEFSCSELHALVNDVVTYILSTMQHETCEGYGCHLYKEFTHVNPDR